MNDTNDIKIPILSFYSGGGFLDMGFEMAGFDIVWTNEVDKVFARCHSEGITSWRKARGNGIKAEIFNTKSIIDVGSEDILNEAFSKNKPLDFGIIGGPPCQDFSIQGNMEGFKGKRGKLTIVFLDRIRELKPTFFVMENVTGLTKSTSIKKHLAKILKGIQNEYYIDHDTLNSLDFGVPQHRERIFFIGIRKDKIMEKDVEVKINGKWFEWPEDGKYKNAEIKYKWPDIAPFGSKIEKLNDLPIELCVESCLVPETEINLIPNAKEFFNLYISEKRLSQIQEGETNRPSFKRLHRYKYSPTACYGNNEVHLHPYLHRRLSVRETLRIQGVPDTYVLPEGLSMTKKFKMIGNGVPVPLSRAIATSLKAFIIDKKVIHQK